MPRPTKRKTSASFKFAIQKKNLSNNHPKRQQNKNLTQLQQPHDTEQQPEPGSSSSHQGVSINPVPEHSIETYQHVQGLRKIACQPLPLHFSKVYHLSAFTAECPACSAKHWIEERVTKSSKQNPVFMMCCTAGKVRLPTPKRPPAELQHYLLDQGQGKKIVCVETKC